MKTNFKQIILPAVIIMMGTGAAFATNQAKQNESKLVSVPGYIYNMELKSCEQVRMCNTEGNEICTLNDLPTGQQVFDLNNPGEFNTCSTILYKP